MIEIFDDISKFLKHNMMIDIVLICPYVYSAWVINLKTGSEHSEFIEHIKLLSYLKTIFQYRQMWYKQS